MVANVNQLTLGRGEERSDHKQSSLVPWSSCTHRKGSPRPNPIFLPRSLSGPWIQAPGFTLLVENQKGESPKGTFPSLITHLPKGCRLVDSNEKQHFKKRTEMLNKTLNRKTRCSTCKLMPNIYLGGEAYVSPQLWLKGGLPCSCNGFLHKAASENRNSTQAAGS